MNEENMNRKERIVDGSLLLFTAISLVILMFVAFRAFSTIKGLLPLEYQGGYTYPPLLLVAIPQLVQLYKGLMSYDKVSKFTKLLVVFVFASLFGSMLYFTESYIGFVVGTVVLSFLLFFASFFVKGIFKLVVAFEPKRQSRS